MANHGGYRKPEHPAPVSGPGALSRRTDGSAHQQPMIAPGNGYGERKDMEQIQTGAPLQGGGGAPPPSALTPLDAPTARPEEPITAGADAGPGPGPEAVGIQNDEQGTMAQLAPLVNSLVTMANMPSSTPEFRAFVRKLRLKTRQQPL